MSFGDVTLWFSQVFKNDRFFLFWSWQFDICTEQVQQFIGQVSFVTLGSSLLEFKFLPEKNYLVLAAISFHIPLNSLSGLFVFDFTQPPKNFPGCKPSFQHLFHFTESKGSLYFCCLFHLHSFDEQIWVKKGRNRLCKRHLHWLWLLMNY